MSGIRLLNKSEIDRTQSRELSREIAEGQKVSRQVDSLRKLRSGEEHNLEEYRSKTLQIIQEGINTLIGEKEALEGQITQLERDIEKKRPYIERKMAEIEEIEKKLSLQNKKLEDREAKIKEGERIIEENSLELSKKLHLADLKEKEAQRLQDQGAAFQALNNEANKKLSRDREYFNAESEKREKWITEEMERLGLWSLELEKEKETNEKEAEKNRKDKIWIADRRAMLQRNAERLKKKKEQ